MFGWLRKKVLNASADSMQNDLERFIAGLQGADAKEIGGMLVIANALRINLVGAGKIPAAALDLSILRNDDLDHECHMCSIFLVNSIKEFQKMGQPSDALGVMIWLHSVRALNVPEIRLYGRFMWAELVRGFPHADLALERLREIGTVTPNTIDEELTFIPRGLEPKS